VGWRVGREPAAGPGGSPRYCAAVPSTTVLLVEDDPVILKLLEVNFELEGYSVLLAHDGAEGIDLARSRAPDLIISDIMMPNVSGIELVETLKAEAGTATIPIILLSAKAQTADIRAGMDAGADDYVTKPFEPLELVEHVQALLAR
jgi:DNA-binding response OmpR family regulator